MRIGSSFCQGTSPRCLYGIGHRQHRHHQNIRSQADLGGVKTLGMGRWLWFHNTPTVGCADDIRFIIRFIIRDNLKDYIHLHPFLGSIGTEMYCTIIQNIPRSDRSHPACSSTSYSKSYFVCCQVARLRHVSSCHFGFN